MRVLAVGAHPDDIELGCGGALLAHRARGDEVTLLVMTTGEQGPQDARSRIGEQEDAAELLGATLRWGGFGDCAVPTDRSAVTVVQDAIDASGADLVYTHAPLDTHQDHRATAAAVRAAARRARRVLLYESPTTTDFSPVVYIDVATLVEAKLDLLRAHMSQVLKNGLVDLEAVEAQARYHGFRGRLRNAEAFESDRFVWDLGGSEPTAAAVAAAPAAVPVAAAPLATVVVPRSRRP
ncbi:PIG-L deacetylase family protein [Pseudonocardia sp. N23]|uniref:PIG-L deacetylase family protein n=1 Tax=Pseudonocardia sp. N23 TaxID=1987376 RepID=UPI000BFD8511|nr:PIG-L deacetylase family protein [Pseudonocardia sp. N23]GAY09550.1 hypothetical protein TOK_3816 [Pseudonocardia sp. N23]